MERNGEEGESRAQELSAEPGGVAALTGAQFVRGTRRHENLSETLPPSIPESMGVRRKTSDCSVCMGVGTLGRGKLLRRSKCLFCSVV